MQNIQKKCIIAVSHSNDDPNMKTDLVRLVYARFMESEDDTWGDIDCKIWKRLIVSDKELIERNKNKNFRAFKEHLDVPKITGARHLLCPFKHQKL